MRRADRLIKIVHFLRSRRLAVTAETIAEHFEVCKRTIYRDINDLIDSGAPIIGEAGVGYTIDKRYYLPPLSFDSDELEAIGLGISMVRQWTDQRFSRQAQSAFEKIQAILPAKLQGEIEQITTYSASNQAQIPWEVDFSLLREYIRNRQKINIEYTSESGETTERVLHPLALIYCGPIWLLAGWCELRQDFRNFRLDRILNVIKGEGYFEMHGEKSLAAYKAQDNLC